MQVLLISAGTAGNMLPFVGLGRCLRRRGHEVLLAGGGNWRSLAAREDLEFFDLDPPAGQHSFDPDNRPVETRALLKQLVEESVYLMRRVYELIAARHVPGQTIVACQGWLIGGRLAHEKLGVPLATVHLQPLLFRTVYVGSRWTPHWMPRAVYRVLDVGIDAALSPALNSLRGELGLPPVKRLMDQWWWSPQAVIGFFPEWFAPRQPDWPSQTILPGFPLYDTIEAVGDRGELERFLAAGPPPLVFSQATLMKKARDYFAVCAEIAAQMGRRAILLTSHPEHLPPNLPPGVRSFGFVPLSEVLPRAAALIHHGGIGSIAQALAAGVPQLTIPKFLDQPDNSRRLARLGVSAYVKPRSFRPEVVIPKLTHLLESPDVSARSKQFAELSRGDNAFPRVAEALEGLLRRKS